MSVVTISPVADIWVTTPDYVITIDPVRESITVVFPLVSVMVVELEVLVVIDPSVLVILVMFSNWETLSTTLSFSKASWDFMLEKTP